jgi:hypothetical protein
MADVGIVSPMSPDGAVAGPHQPLADLPTLSPGSVRRTSNIDTTRPTGADPIRSIEARARDITVGAHGEAEVLGSVVLQARVDPTTYELQVITSEPADPRMDELVGASVGPGFRRRLAEVLASPADHNSLAHQLLDDLTGAQLVAGYDVVHRDITTDDPDREPHRVDPLLITSRFDFCAGWANDGSMVEAIHATGRIPVPMGPPAPPLGRVKRSASAVQLDAGWHDMAPLSDGAMRRRRRLDVQSAEDGMHPFEAHFRDSHVSDDGEETIVHEYLVHGLVDAGTRTIVAVDSEARVLPWRECPNALASSAQIVGWPLDELRRRVHRELTGVSSCTHRNDTLRSLSDLDVLLDRTHPS